MSEVGDRVLPSVVGGLTGLDKVMIAILAVALGAGCFLISSPVGTEVGHQAWKEGSILRILAELMSLNYEYPTPRGVEVKWLVLGLGSSAALLAGVLAWYMRAKRAEEGLLESRSWFSLWRIESAGSAVSWSRPETLAQLLLFLFACWALLSALWSPWPAASFGEGIRQLMVAFWAIALGRTLGRTGARGAAWTMFIILSVTAIIGIWYHIERNPVQRLKFPIGNPIFMAACLLPGLAFGLAMVAGEFRYAVEDCVGSQSPGDRAQSESNDVWYPRWVVFGAIVGLVVLFWAFRLSGSRGPFLGLVVGLAVMVFVVLSKRGRWLFFILALLVAVAGGFWIKSQLGALEMGRGATIRLRLNTMEYAGKLFALSPFCGHGQGSYILKAQSMSLPDAAEDPIAFPAALVGHTHNEWLEILAELGLVGFVLMGGVLVLTFWSICRALRSMKKPVERFCLLGLLAAFVAIVVEESGDVALRMAGLPIVFYALLGIIWAMVRKEDSGEGDVSCIPGRAIRVLVLLCGLALAGGLAKAASRDWRGALADMTIADRVNSREWVQAFSQARLAASQRLDISNLLLATFQEIQVGYQAGLHQLTNLRSMLERRGKDSDINQARIVQIARQDAIKSRQYFDFCERKALAFWERMEFYPYLAGIIGKVYFHRFELDVMEKSLGLREEVRSDLYIPEAAKWMELEYQRNILDAETALNFFNLAGGYPLGYRIDLLRIPLRSGPIHERVIPTLAKLMEEPGFDETVSELRARAEATLEAGDDVSYSDEAGKYDIYAPETFRLLALAERLRGNFAEAADLAAKSAVLYVRIRDRFPTAASYAYMDQAGYSLLAHPEEAELAIAACKQAIDSWPPFGDRDRKLMPLRWNLSLYYLAADNEHEAGKIISSIIEQMTGEQSVDRNMGYGYGELCRDFYSFPRDRRPKSFGKWLQRSLQLAPNLPTTRSIAVQVALEDGQDDAAVSHLRMFELLLKNPEQQMNMFLDSLISKFPSRADVLGTYRDEFLKRVSAKTQPAAGGIPTGH